jgi:hypothetical protein
MKRIKNYSKTALLLVSVLFIACLNSCKKGQSYVKPVSTDLSKPAVVTNIKVKNFNGGAYITYDLPNSDNLLYIQAEYRINDKTTRQTKSSYYSDTVTVDGFANSQDYEITLYSVSRANVKSDPLTVKVHPDTPFYKLIKPTVSISSDFGGVNIRAMNPSKKDIGVILLAFDKSTQALEVEDQHYTSVDTINYSIRGYPAVSQKFGVYITDKFGNVSDTTILNITPIFETLLDKTKFSIYKTATDSPTAYGWEVPYLWDNKTDGYSNGWHTAPGAPAPIQCTFSLGVSAQLSRFILWERPDQYAYAHGNPKDFTIWGSNVTAPRDVRLPDYAPEGAVVGDWVNIGNYHYPNPPSGLTPGFTNAADATFVAAGVNFNTPPGSPAVKYFRFMVHDTWSNGDFAHVMEFSIYGNPQ